MDNTPTVPNQPAPQTQPQPAQAQEPAKKKTSPWVWVLSGCLVIILLGFATLGFLGWLGYRAAKEAIHEQTPNIEELKNRADRMNAEADEWNKKAEQLQKESKKMRDSLPQPEDENQKGPALE